MNFTAQLDQQQQSFKITIEVSRDYSCLMSPNKDETGRRIVSDAVVVDLAVKFIVYYRWHKTSQLVDDGRNKYWLTEV